MLVVKLYLVIADTDTEKGLRTLPGPYYRPFAQLFHKPLGTIERFGTKYGTF